MKLFYKVFSTLIFMTLMTACGGGDDSGDVPMTPNSVPDPSATTLVFPENNTECNEGVIVNDTQSTVTFRWDASADTDSYEVNVRNLNTNNSSITNSSGTEIPITIERGTPYEWFVVSKANGTNVTTNSATFRFYNQGPGVENYAPFPAEAVSPQRGSTINTSGTIALEWNGSDVDNDIVDFEVLFGNDADPSEILGTTSTSTIEASVTAGQTYYWRIITRDSQDNTSQSEIFEFLVSN